MAVVMQMKWAGVTKDQYDQAVQEVQWETNTPKGAKYHVASFDGDGLRVTDVWDSEADFNAFAEARLMPGIQKIGIEGQPDVEFLPVHRTFAPNP